MMTLRPIHFQGGQHLQALREMNEPLLPPEIRSSRVMSRPDIVRCWPEVGLKPGEQTIGRYEEGDIPDNVYLLAEVLAGNEGPTREQLEATQNLNTIDVFQPFKTKHGEGELGVNFMKQLGILCSYAKACGVTLGEIAYLVLMPDKKTD